MTSSGMSAFVRCTCSACGRTFSSAKRWKVSRTSSKSSSRCRGPSVVGQRRQDRRLALRLHESGHGRRPAGLDAPERLAAGHLAQEVGHHVGHEGRGDGRLDVPLLAVLEGGPGRAHRGGGVRDVVRHDLVGVDAAAARRGAGLVDELLRQVDRSGGAGEIGGGGRSHGARP